MRTIADFLIECKKEYVNFCASLLAWFCCNALKVAALVWAAAVLAVAQCLVAQRPRL